MYVAESRQRFDSSHGALPLLLNRNCFPPAKQKYPVILCKIIFQWTLFRERIEVCLSTVIRTVKNMHQASWKKAEGNSVCICWYVHLGDRWKSIGSENWLGLDEFPERSGWTAHSEHSRRPSKVSVKARSASVICFPLTSILCRTMWMENSASFMGIVLGGFLFLAFLEENQVCLWVILKH